MHSTRNPIIIIIISSKRNDIQMIASRVNRLGLVSFFFFLHLLLHLLLLLIPLFSYRFVAWFSSSFLIQTYIIVIVPPALLRVDVHSSSSSSSFSRSAPAPVGRQTRTMMRKWALVFGNIIPMASRNAVQVKCEGWCAAAAQPIRYACLWAILPTPLLKLNAGHARLT